MIDSLGKITVPVPGTPIPVTINRPDPTKTLSCHAIMFEALPTNTGSVYVGRHGMNKTTLDGVFAILLAPTATSLPTFGVSLTLAPNGLAAQQFHVDADVADDGVLSTFLQL